MENNILNNPLPESYEAALKELQDILDNLENQHISVDEITLHTRRARFLVDFCRKKIRKIEEDTEQLL